MRGDGGVVGVGADVGFGAEVGEVEHGGGEGSERGREGELGCRGEVELGFGAGAGAKAMELGAECLLDLGGVAGEGDAVAIGGRSSMVKPWDWSQDLVAAMSASAMPKRAAKSAGVSQ